MLDADATPEATPEATPDADGDVALLRRQLARERFARQTAESIGETATAELWRTVEQLRSAQAELRAKVEQSELLHRLGREIRLDLDPHLLMRRAATSLGEALGVDRCLVRLADDTGIGLVVEQWTRPGVPPLPHGTRLPAGLGVLAEQAIARREGLWIDDVDTDERLDAHATRTTVEVLGCRAYAGTPMLAGSHLVGWLVLQDTGAARVWTDHDRAVLEGVAHDLGGALLQAQAHQHQLETVATLQEVDAVKSEFVSRVSHELRTPLTSISGYAEMLAEESFGPVSPGQQRVLGVVERNCERLLTMVENLLTLSRVDAGELRLQHTAVDLGAVVGDVCLALAPSLVGRRLEVDFAPVPDTPGLVGDRQEIERILLNLLTNAIKFTPDGGRVAFTATCGPAAVVLIVRDTGHGVSAADQGQLFRRFFRASTAVDQAIPGTGLGLSLVKSMVDAHGGRIQVDSTPGVGTTMTVTLPLVG